MTLLNYIILSENFPFIRHILMLNCLMMIHAYVLYLACVISLTIAHKRPKHVGEYLMLMYHMCPYVTQLLRIQLKCFKKKVIRHFKTYLLLDFLIRLNEIFREI
jgi:hypothetical protein